MHDLPAAFFSPRLRAALAGLLLGAVFAAAGSPARAADIELTDVTAWTDAPDRHWIGADFWANRLQDWAVKDGVLTCAASYGGLHSRTAHLLTYELVDAGDLILDPVPGHTVVKAIDGAGPERATLSVVGRLAGDTIELTATLSDGDTVVAKTTGTLDAARVAGSVALVSNGSDAEHPHRFRGLRIGGDRVAAHPERAVGPIAGVLYGVANGDLKVGVQCVSLRETMRPPPFGKKVDKPARLAVRLEQKLGDGTWEPVGRPTAVAEPDYYALIRITGYDATEPRDFRVVTNGAGDVAASYGFHVPAEPEGDVVVGAVSCSGAMGRRSGRPEKTSDGELYVGRWTDANVWFPWEGVSGPLMERNPDIVFFTGDQLYEYNPTARHPTDAFPHDDYLYKWLLWHWAFNDLTRQVPTVMQTDDHDVWHPTCGVRAAG